MFEYLMVVTLASTVNMISSIKPPPDPPVIKYETVKIVKIRRIKFKLEVR